MWVWERARSYFANGEAQENLTDLNNRVEQAEPRGQHLSEGEQLNGADSRDENDSDERISNRTSALQEPSQISFPSEEATFQVGVATKLEPDGQEQSGVKRIDKAATKHDQDRQKNISVQDHRHQISNQELVAEHVLDSTSFVMDPDQQEQNLRASRLETAQLIPTWDDHSHAVDMSPPEERLVQMNVEGDSHQPEEIPLLLDGDDREAQDSVAMVLELLGLEDDKQLLDPILDKVEAGVTPLMRKTDQEKRNFSSIGHQQNEQVPPTPVHATVAPEANLDERQQNVKRPLIDRGLQDDDPLLTARDVDDLSAPASISPAQEHPGRGRGQGAKVSALRTALLAQASPFSPQARRRATGRVHDQNASSPTGNREPLAAHRHTADKEVQIDVTSGPHQQPQLVQDLQAFFNDRARKPEAETTIVAAQAEPCKAKLPRPSTSRAALCMPDQGVQVQVVREHEHEGSVGPAGDSPAPAHASTQKSDDRQSDRAGTVSSHRTHDDGVEDKCLECCVYYSVRCCECTIL